MSERLYQHWKARSVNLGCGDEYQLVDEFADILNLRDWYEWRPDVGQHKITAEPIKEGTTNPKLLTDLHPAAMFYFIDILRKFDKMTKNEVGMIAAEVGMVGLNGLDYSDSEKKYSLKSLSGEKFTGLYMMCLMYAGFQRIAPAEDCGMDLHDPYLTALQMHQAGQGGHGSK